MTPTVAYLVIPDYSSNVFCPANSQATAKIYKSKQLAESEKGEGEKIVRILIQLD